MKENVRAVVRSYREPRGFALKIGERVMYISKIPGNSSLIGFTVSDFAKNPNDLTPEEIGKTENASYLVEEIVKFFDTEGIMRTE